MSVSDGNGLSGGPGARRLLLTLLITCAHGLTVFDVPAEAGLLQNLYANETSPRNMSVQDAASAQNGGWVFSVASWSSGARQEPSNLRSVPVLVPRSSCLVPRASCLVPRASCTCARGPNVLSISESEDSSLNLCVSVNPSASFGFISILRRVFAGSLFVAVGGQSKCSLSLNSVSIAVGLILLNLPRTGAVVCPHCKDTITGCLGGGDAGASCPTVKTVVANANIFAQQLLEKTPTVMGLITPDLCTTFTRPICDAILGLACAPKKGSSLDLQEMTTGSHPTFVYTASAVVKAATYGYCSVAEAMTELGRRVDLASSELEVAKIQASISGLKTIGETVLSSTQGVLQFLWARCSMAISGRYSGTYRVEVSSTSKSTALSASLVRPQTQDAYYELLHYFGMVVTALGIANALVLMNFLDKVAYGAVRLAEGWKVSCELVLLYLKKVDQDPTGSLSLANVFEHGGQDTMLSEARRNAGAFFRTRSGELRPGPAPSGGQQFNPTSKKLCKDYNAGRPCTRLDSQGKCVFNHACDQWVTDKGTAGVCGGAHPRCDGCSYDESKKCRKAATE